MIATAGELVEEDEAIDCTLFCQSWYPEVSWM